MSLIVREVTVYGDEGNEQSIIDGVSCSMTPGGITLIVGRTGSGKSTLLHVLAGLKVPHKGTVTYGERSLWSEGRADRGLMKRIGMVFQYPEHQLFAATVEEELRYSLRPFRLSRKEQELRIQEALDSTGLETAFLERSPFHLSGGEKRKAALASVLAAKPELLFLDEPSSGLDSGAAARFVEWILRYKEQHTDRGGVVIATHDLDLFLSVADQVLFLREGKLIGSLAAKEAVKNPSLFLEAGIGIPAIVRLAQWAEGDGRHEQGGTLFRSLQPEALAEAILSRVSSGTELPQRRSESPYKLPEPLSSAPKAFSKPIAPAESLDPRGKWIAYMLFSLGLFVFPGWLSTAVGLAVLFLAGGWSNVSFKKWIRPVIPFIVFMGISAFIAGLHLNISFQPQHIGPVSYLWEEGLATLEKLAPLLPVIGGGMLFSATTSPTAMRKGLEAPLRIIPGFSKGAEIIAVSAALLFRFINVISSEIERFALIASSRGKVGGKPGKLRILQLRSFLTPLLLSILQHAEELSVAMEARGYGRVKNRFYKSGLQFGSQDVKVVGLGIGFVLMLFLISKW